jgi:hypothetical protein
MSSFLSSFRCLQAKTLVAQPDQVDLHPLHQLIARPSLEIQLVEPKLIANGMQFQPLAVINLQALEEALHQLTANYSVLKVTVWSNHIANGKPQQALLKPLVKRKPQALEEALHQ